MAECRNIGQKIEDRLIDMMRRARPPFTPGMLSVRHFCSLTQRLIVCLASPRQSASSAGVILSFSFIIIY
jgi:hypothetical protein